MSISHNPPDSMYGTSHASCAPGERQPAAAGLYSGAMIMMPHIAPLPLPPLALGRLFFNREVYASRRGGPLNMGNFVRVLSNSAPSPIVPAGKLNTTQTMLPSGEGLKKLNFVGIMLNSSPVLAPPFAPGGYLSFPCQPVFVRRLANYTRQAVPSPPYIQSILLSCPILQSSFFNFQSSIVNRQSTGTPADAR